MPRVLTMPDHVANLIDFALTPLGIMQSRSSNEILAYALHYDTGLTLIVGMACIEQRKLFIFKHTTLRISVFEHTSDNRSNCHHLTRFLPLPQSANDMRFNMAVLAKFASMTRAVADTLGAGDCLNMGKPEGDK